MSTTTKKRPARTPVHQAARTQTHETETNHVARRSHDAQDGARDLAVPAVAERNVRRTAGGCRDGEAVPIVPAELREIVGKWARGWLARQRQREE